MRIEIDIDGKITEHEDAPIILPTEEQLINEKVAEAQALLDRTQFKFGDDYDQKDTHEWLALKVKRQEAREFIRANDVPNS